LGVVTNIPCIGVAKRLLYCDGITAETVHNAFLASKTDIAILVGESGQPKAAAFRVPKQQYTLYISPGHLIDLDTALQIVQTCMKGHELPDPTFQADRLSRQFLKLNYAKMK